MVDASILFFIGDRFEFFLQINKQEISIGQEHCYMSIYFSGFKSQGRCTEHEIENVQGKN